MPVQLLVNQMVYNSVTYGRFVDVARLRIGNIKRRIRTMNVCFVPEICIEACNVSSKLSLKCNNILFMLFTAQ